MKLDKEASLSNKAIAFNKCYYVLMALSDKIKQNYLIDGPIEILENGISYYDLEGRKHTANILGSGLMIIDEISEEELNDLKSYFDYVNDGLGEEKYDFRYVKTKNRPN